MKRCPDCATPIQCAAVDYDCGHDELKPMSRLVVLRGPFTSEELREIIATVSVIEARRPDEVFEMAVDASDFDGDAQKLLDTVNPLRPGYERVVKYWRREPTGREG